jgi:protein AFG1
VISSFEDLCQKNLGSADFYALCKATSIIYLTGLRTFIADELDSVGRFITLVDLAYEAKISIVCLSMAALLEVFTNIMPSRIPAQAS